MTRKHAGFTDLRILGGSRQRGGGVDADPRIKLPPGSGSLPSAHFRAVREGESTAHRGGGARRFQGGGGI